ncbi:hypothetical protein BGZ54_004443 [Gamsiella multidivaricata]|nr:hypothetical protein BGZ54_004443 [Gamsiella multidivaricata]
MHDRGVSNVEFTRPSSPQPTVVRASTTSIHAPIPTTPTRRSNFSLTLPWRPQSEYFSNTSSSGLSSSLTKPQRRFIRAFPELANLVMVPSSYCAPCLATPPPTPPSVSTISPSASMTTSHTANTVSTASSDFSSSWTLANNNNMNGCPGHFDDFACALEREILWQGTLYLTATHVCFYGRHFGKTVRIMVDYMDVVAIEKEKKMGVFPSSIRIRVRVPPTTAAAGDDSNTKEEPVKDGKQPIKDYVFTSLMSREQAYSIMERNWTVHRQVMQTLVHTGLESPPVEGLEAENQTMDAFNLTLKPRGKLSSLRAQRKGAPRTYSVVTDETFSSTENVDRPTLHNRFSSALSRPSTPTQIQGTGYEGSSEFWNSATTEEVLQKSEDSSVRTDSRRNSVASSAGSSSEKQQLNTGLIGFLQMRSNQGNKRNKSDSGSTADQQQQQQGGIALNAVATAAYPSPPSSSPIMVQASLSSELSRDNDMKLSCTPPPVLISPSLMTTKMLYSSSAVQSVALPSSVRNASVHIRKEGAGASLDPSLGDAEVAAAAKKKPAALLPTAPVSCGCQRHYKNAVVSAVIPLPLELCFEILFSGKGAGQGDKLGCETHRIKDGSTEIKIMPWQECEAKELKSGSKKTISALWESQKRNLEYSVSFKVPMLAKTSTPCFEIQQVTHYSDFMILVHSESRTPNVPYGEHFSTVNQICMTWEAPGQTKIKCFTEVKFKKSIMWSSKVEAGSLEGSGGFYKEFIRQLQDLAETQGTQLLAEAAAASAPEVSPEANSALDVPTLGLTKQSGQTAIDKSLNAITSHTAAASPALPASSLPGPSRASAGATTTTSSLQASEMIQAHTLLTRQFFRSTSPPISEPTPAEPPVRPSLSFARPQSEPSTILEVKDQLAPLLPSEKKSALSVLLESFAPPGSPIITVAAAADVVWQHENKAALLPTQVKDNRMAVSNAETVTATAIATSAPSSPLWGGFVRRGWTFFGRSTTVTAASEPSTPTTSIDRAATDSGPLSTITSSSVTFQESKQNDSVRVKFALPAASRRSFARSTDDGSSRLSTSSSVRSFASVPSLASSFREHGQRGLQGQQPQQQQWQYQSSSLAQPTALSLTKDMAQQQQQQQQRDPLSRLLSRAIFAFVVLGMMVTTLNAWHLFSIVESMVEVVQQRHDLIVHQLPQHHHQQYPHRLHSRLQMTHRHGYAPQCGDRYVDRRGPYESYNRYYYLQQQQQRREDDSWKRHDDLATWEQNQRSTSEYEFLDTEPNLDMDMEPEAQKYTVDRPPPSSSSSPSPSSFPAPKRPAVDEQPQEEEQEQEQYESESRMGSHVEELRQKQNRHQQTLDPLNTQKELLMAEIVELFALLEHARRELSQTSSSHN